MSDMSISDSSFVKTQQFNKESGAGKDIERGVSQKEGLSVQPKKTETEYDGQKLDNENERERARKEANALFDSLNTELALKFHEKSGQWYAIIENKITHEVIKEVPPKEIMDLRARLKEMIGFFLDKKI